jgi:hypothetical protein
MTKDALWISSDIISHEHLDRRMCPEGMADKSDIFPFSHQNWTGLVTILLQARHI